MAKKTGRPRVAAFTFGLLGFRLGLVPIGDNSALTHIRTGMDMVSNGRFPRSDIYSFTAVGRAWNPQSWLPEWIYGVLLDVNQSGHLLLLFNAVVLAALAYSVATLATSDSLIHTVGYSVIAVALGYQMWTPRPNIVAFLCFALLIRLLHAQKSIYWIIPVALVWQWSHGSYVIGAGFLTLFWIGCLIDKKPSVRSRSMLIAFSLTVVAASLFPYGPHTLLFFLVPFHRPEVFKVIVEWRSPDFQTAAALITLGGVAFFLFAMNKAVLPWRYKLPSLVFLVASLYSFRNFGFLSVVAASTLGYVGNTAGARTAPVNTSRIDRGLIAFLLLIAVVQYGASTANPAFDVSAYPVAAVNWMESEGYMSNSLRLVEREAVGNYLICRYGSKYKVFGDDRFDFYPIQHERDARTLINGNKSPREVLDRNRIDLVIWEKKTYLAQWMDEANDWEAIHSDKKYVVFKRIGVTPGDSVKTDRSSPCAPDF